MSSKILFKKSKYNNSQKTPFDYILGYLLTEFMELIIGLPRMRVNDIIFFQVHKDSRC